MSEVHTVLTLEDEATVAEAGAEIFIASACAAVEVRGRFVCALAGGTTPGRLYSMLARPEYSSRIPWEHCFLFFGDERCVPRDHPDSNFRGGYQALLEPRGVPEGNIHRIQGELKPAEAAGSYEQDLLDWFGDPRPRFDLILLGMGDDGHTASLFPGTSLVASPKRDGSSLVEAVQVPKLANWRITFTPYLINAASMVVLLVTGAAKASALKAVLEGPYQPAVYPAQLVQPANGKLTWLIDQDAASLLEP